LDKENQKVKASVVTLKKALKVAKNKIE